MNWLRSCVLVASRSRRSATWARSFEATDSKKADFIESGVGCIHYGQIHTHYRTSATKTITFVSPGLANRLRHARTGDLVIATTSEDNEAVGKAVAWLGAEAIAVSGDAYIYRHSLDPKYVAYFFQSEQFSVQKKPYITGHEGSAPFR